MSHLAHRDGFSAYGNVDIAWCGYRFGPRDKRYMTRRQIGRVVDACRACLEANADFVAAVHAKNNSQPIRGRNVQ